MVKDKETQEEAQGNDEEAWPEGFEEIDISYEDVPAVNWEMQPRVTGEVVGKGTRRVNRKGDKVETDYIDVMDSRGVFRVWESAMLQGVIDQVSIGQFVSIRYTGKESIGDGKTRRMFEARVRG